MHYHEPSQPPSPPPSLKKEEKTSTVTDFQPGELLVALVVVENSYRPIRSHLRRLPRPALCCIPYIHVDTRTDGRSSVGRMAPLRNVLRPPGIADSILRFRLLLLTVCYFMYPGAVLRLVFCTRQRDTLIIVITKRRLKGSEKAIPIPRAAFFFALYFVIPGTGIDCAVPFSLGFGLVRGRRRG